MGRRGGILTVCGPASISGLDNLSPEYQQYLTSFAQPDSPKIRDANPTVVLVPGIGMFSFGKNKTEARITGEFYTNAIHVMEGATALGGVGRRPRTAVLPQAGPAATTDAFERAFELRSAAAFGSISHRVLASGRSEDAPPAAGERIEPAESRGCRRWQRNWTRDRASGGSTRCACCGGADRDLECGRER